MWKLESLKLHILSLADQSALANGLIIELNQHFENVDVNWDICPDLSEEPFNLAAKGICLNTAIIDIGDKSYMEPSPILEKKHKIQEVIPCLHRDLDRDSFIFGCGYSERSNGTLDELVMNVSFPVTDGEMQMINKSRIVFVNSTENKCEVEMNVEPTCIAQGSFFISEGSSDGMVLKVSAKKLRLAEDQVPVHELFARSMNTVLQQVFPEKIVGLGGVYRLRNLEWRLHNLQNNGNDQANASSNFCTINVPEPVIGTFNSTNMSLQVQVLGGPWQRRTNLGMYSSFHCFSHHNKSHLCRETIEEGVDILGYFRPARILHRIDKPDHQAIS